MASTSNHSGMSSTDISSTLQDEMGEAKRVEKPLKEEDTEKTPNAAGNTSNTFAVITGRPTSGSHASPETKKVQPAPLPVEVDFGGKNWIGLLIEFRQANPKETGPIYNEYTIALDSFTCTVSIGECPTPIGIDGPRFRKKKDAKQYAAKLAIEWLIQNSYMPSDGSVSFPKTHLTSTGAVNVNNSKESPGQEVARLCHVLGMPPPTYVITSDAEFGSMWSGYAHFGGHHIGKGKIGEFKDVFGQKNARLECAQKVLEYLQGIKKDREGAT